MRANIEKSLALLKPCAHVSAHALHAAHSEITTELTKLYTQQEASKAAVLYVLDRIKREEPVGYLLGYGTKAFHLLSTAAALALDQTVDQVESYVFGEDPKPVTK